MIKNSICQYTPNSRITKTCFQAKKNTSKYFQEATFTIASFPKKTYKQTTDEKMCSITNPEENENQNQRNNRLKPVRMVIAKKSKSVGEGTEKREPL